MQSAVALVGDVKSVMGQLSVEARGFVFGNDKPWSLSLSLSHTDPFCFSLRNS